METFIVPRILNSPHEVEHARRQKTSIQYVLNKRVDLVFKRTRAAEAQGWKCCYCGVHMSVECKSKNSVTLEHVIPKSQGGTDNPDNLVAACNRCNTRRGTMSWKKFDPQKHVGSNAEVRLAKKIRKYTKRALKVDQSEYEAWIKTLRMPSHGLQKLILSIKTAREMENNG